MNITLQSGAHEQGKGYCAMEYAAYLAGEAHSDKPECVSPVIGAFMRSWNDALSDADRQRLKPWIVKCLHTNTGAKDDETRDWLATDWLVRECAPAWLDLAGLTERATELRNLPALTSSEIAVAVQSVIEHARRDAATAWDAARAAARAAAVDAAMAAAWDAARAAAWAAAVDAARAAARERLAPTVAWLQESAFGLLGRMIQVGQPAERTLGVPHHQDAICR